MSRLSNGMTFLLAATAVVAVVQLEVTSSVRATSLPAQDVFAGEPLHDVNRTHKSARLAFERSAERDVTYVLYDGRTQDKATATRIRLEKPAPAHSAPAQSDLAWEQSSEFRDTCEPLVSPMIAEELKIAPRRCPT
jgi:uncharacterized membrane protein